MLKSRSEPMWTEEKLNAWIFEKDGRYVGFSLEGTTVTFSLIPRDDLNELCHIIEKSEYRVVTSGGELQIIREKAADKEGSPNARESFLVRVGKALMNTFLGGDWDPEIAFVYPANLPEFTRRVLEETRKIPKGKIATYGEIAERIGSPGGARAVGNALARNPLALIVPCHRVVKSDGRVGGFMKTADGSVRSDLKREMLKREGVRFLRGKVVKGTHQAVA